MMRRAPPSTCAKQKAQGAKHVSIVTALQQMHTEEALIMPDDVFVNIAGSAGELLHVDSALHKAWVLQVPQNIYGIPLVRWAVNMRQLFGTIDKNVR